jgi:VWFA-related protein
MRTVGFLAVVALGGLSAAAISAGQSSRPAAPASPPGQQPQSTQSGYVLKVRTRLVTLDVIATDSQGNMVRDLKADELQVFEERNKQQKIAAFEFVDTAANAAAPKAAPATPAGSNFYSNAVALEALRVPPTVLLMDSLNSTSINQQRARSHMIELLRTLPEDTPVAVFLLGNTPRLLQGFTSDPALLRAAVEKAMGLSPTRIEKNPQDDPNSPAQVVAEMDDPELLQAVQSIQDFAKEQYADSIDLRARVTIETLTSIARSLSGIRGRKNLIWLSESFPFSIAPDADFGSNPFAGIRDYAADMKAAANALTDAQVALYPVDLRGLEASQALAASERVQLQRGVADSGIGAALTRERNDIIQAQETMDALAADTGGRTCKNSNDLSGCIVAALKDGSSYYEVGFYPENVKWDGKYHNVSVKTSRRGVTLNYRRSYFAMDADTLAKAQKPEDLLRQACSDLLPSTSIHLVAQAVPPASPAPGAGPRYLFLIAPGGLSRVQIGAAHGINAQAATCEFNVSGDSFQFSMQKLVGTASDDLFQKWQAEGLPDFVTLAPNPATHRVRFVVLDVPTGLTGAIDVPVRPEDRAMKAAPAPTIKAVSAVLAIPDRLTSPQTYQPRATGALTFGVASGKSGTLDWNGDVLLYRGDLALDQSASAFFDYAFGARFRCQTGSLVPNDPAGGQPKLQFIVGNHNGKVVTVDLKGAQPQYSGDLPVDPTAQAFFDRVWRLSHCQAP